MKTYIQSFLNENQNPQKLQSSSLLALHLEWVARDPAARDLLVRSVPTLAGLAFIPVIVHPLDTAVHWALDASYRPLAKRYVREQAFQGVREDECRAEYSSSEEAAEGVATALAAEGGSGHLYGEADGGSGAGGIVPSGPV